jgi:hypothetical protein
MRPRSDEHERGRDWQRAQRENWRGNAENLQRVADERGRWITELEQARDWAMEQAANWRREAEDWRRKAEESEAAPADYESSRGSDDARKADRQ